MRNRGSEHLEEVILEFELFILDEVGDALGEDHGVRFTLEEDWLLLEGDDLLAWPHSWLGSQFLFS